MNSPTTDLAGKTTLHGYIDAHVHAWTDDVGRYPISPPYQPGEMNPRAALPETLLRQAQASNVGRIVLIQMSYYGCDNSYLLDVGRRFPGVFAMIGVVDWRAEDPCAEMLKLARQGVKGFRVDAEGDIGAECLKSQGLRKMFECAELRQLALCFLMLPDALEPLSQLCARFPQSPVVVDHLAQIGANGLIPEEQIHALCALSKYTHVKVKVSAFYALGAKRPQHLELIPLIRRVFDAFGPERLMWGSDWPFQVADETYDDSIALVRDRLDFLSSDDKQWILRKTAQTMFFD